MLVSFVLALLKVVGSLVLTVTILVVLVAILLWGMAVEAKYGETVAKFGIYGAWWFNTLGLLLGLNSAAALVLRLPWKLQHLGFIIPHLGLIVLLVGCFVSRHYGIEATLSVFEGQSSDLAYKGSSQHVELDGQQHFRLRVISADKQQKAGESIKVPFTSGPFNWDDYRKKTLEFFVWSLAHRDQGVLYDRNGVRLEVLDYFSNSEIVPAADQSGFSARALPFDKNKSNDRSRVRQAYVRLTVDEQSEEFWMPCSSPDRLDSLSLAIPKQLLKKSVAGKGRRVDLSFAPESFPIGYTIYLRKAWRKLDPGTRQPSFYGSEIDLVPNEHAAPSSGKEVPKYENLLVTLNAPLDFADPAFPGRSYRMFQSTMDGPYNPEEVGLKLGESAYLSGFTLNYDPGRGLTYMGCLLICAGIVVAYFVRLKSK
ncbi:MAG: hypothetical protein WCJ35_23020 [Planctomycetota bacterium]